MPRLLSPADILLSVFTVAALAMPPNSSSAMGSADPALVARGYTFLTRTKAEKVGLGISPEYIDLYSRVLESRKRFELLSVNIGTDITTPPFWLHEFAADCEAPAARMVSVSVFDARWKLASPSKETVGAIWQLPQVGSAQRFGLDATCKHP